MPSNLRYELFAGLLVGNERNKLNRTKTKEEIKKYREKRNKKRKSKK